MQNNINTMIVVCRCCRWAVLNSSRRKQLGLTQDSFVICPVNGVKTTLHTGGLSRRSLIADLRTYFDIGVNKVLFITHGDCKTDKAFYEADSRHRKVKVCMSEIFVFCTENNLLIDKQFKHVKQGNFSMTLVFKKPATMNARLSELQFVAKTAYA